MTFPAPVSSCWRINCSFEFLLFKNHTGECRASSYLTKSQNSACWAALGGGISSWFSWVRVKTGRDPATETGFNNENGKGQEPEEEGGRNT